MILLRFNKLDGQYCEIEGGQRIKAIYKYGVNNMGWMPIDSMNFGFEGAKESEQGLDGKEGSGGQQGGSGRGTQPTKGKGQDKKKDDKKKQETTISVNRAVDRATPQIMGFAMEDRKKTKEDKENLRKVDIHLLHSVHAYKGSTATDHDMFVYPYLLITLANVLVKNWGISASGDDRPQEQFELWFDKVAMSYSRTADGRVWQPAVRKGWDMHKNDWWAPSEGEAPFFKEPNG